MKTRYVLGFLFREDLRSVVLLRKNKPEWQAGLLNGIGGKIETSETELQAMLREFREETGVETHPSIWKLFCEMSGDDWVVYCYAARNTGAWASAKSQETETERIEKLHPGEVSRVNAVSNLPWLLAMALDDNYGKQFRATVRYSFPYTLTDLG